MESQHVAISVDTVVHRKSQRKHYDPASPPEIPIFGSAPIVAHTLQIVFRLSRPRTWVFPASSFILGYTIAGGTQFSQIALGLIVAALVTAATNIVNAFADKHEDAVNQPSRVFWIDQIGSKGTVASTVVLYGTAVAVSVFLGPLFMIVLAVGIFNSVFYSARPLRFKARPFPSLVSFSGAVGLAFLSGASIMGSLNLSNPVLWLVTYFMFTYGTVKNLPDYLGDKKVGTHTSATIFKNINSAARFSAVLLFTPYILLIGLVLVGSLSTIYLADVGLAVILAFIVLMIFRSKGSQQLEKAHTFGFFYAISFLLFTIVLSSPTLLSITIILTAYLWTLLVSKVNIDSRVETRDWEKPRGHKT